MHLIKDLVKSRLFRFIVDKKIGFSVCVCMCARARVFVLLNITYLMGESDHAFHVPFSFHLLLLSVNSYIV